MIPSMTSTVCPFAVVKEPEAPLPTERLSVVTTLASIPTAPPKPAGCVQFAFATGMKTSADRFAGSTERSGNAFPRPSPWRC